MKKHRTSLNLLKWLTVLVVLAWAIHIATAADRPGVLHWDVTGDEERENLYGWNIYSTTNLTPLPPKEKWNILSSENWPTITVTNIVVITNLTGTKITNEFKSTTWDTNGWTFREFVAMTNANLSIYPDYVVKERGLDYELLVRTNDVWQWLLTCDADQEFFILTATNMAGESFPSSVVWVPAPATNPRNAGARILPPTEPLPVSP